MSTVVINDQRARFLSVVITTDKPIIKTFTRMSFGNNRAVFNDGEMAMELRSEIDEMPLTESIYD